MTEEWQTNAYCPCCRHYDMLQTDYYFTCTKCNKKWIMVEK